MWATSAAMAMVGCRRTNAGAVRLWGALCSMQRSRVLAVLAATAALPMPLAVILAHGWVRFSVPPEQYEAVHV
jgi:hypothetical protein